MSFSQNLKRVMAEREISQSELATLIGKGKSSISQYLSGSNIPKMDVQQKIAEVLDCTVEYLNSEIAEEIPISSKPYNISIAEAAIRLNKSQQFIRIALQTGRAPFGFAAKKNSKWSYHISPKKLDEYINA